MSQLWSTKVISFISTLFGIALLLIMIYFVIMTIFGGKDTEDVVEDYGDKYYEDLRKAHEEVRKLSSKLKEKKLVCAYCGRKKEGSDTCFGCGASEWI